jgi:hypothetical protein
MSRIASTMRIFMPSRLAGSAAIEFELTPAVALEVMSKVAIDYLP